MSKSCKDCGSDLELETIRMPGKKLNLNYKVHKREKTKGYSYWYCNKCMRVKEGVV